MENSSVPGSYILEGIVNFRDVGVSSGGILKSGRIFRSATPSEATPKDVEFISKTLGIKTILDLRTTAESAADIGEKLLKKEFVVIPETDVFRIPEIEALRQEHGKLLFQLPIIPSNLSFLRELGTGAKAKLAFYQIFGMKEQSNRIISDMMVQLRLQGLYRLVLKTSWRNILRGLDLLSDPENYPVLIHCTQGKDRTGMLVSLLMHVCGVKEEVIADDYCKSEPELEAMRSDPVYMKRNFAKAANLGLDMTSWMLSPREAIEDTFKWVQSQFGGYPYYMQWIGFNLGMQAKLKTILAGPHDPKHNIDLFKPKGSHSVESFISERNSDGKMTGKEERQSRVRISFGKKGKDTPITIGGGPENDLMFSEGHLQDSEQEKRLKPYLQDKHQKQLLKDPGSTHSDSDLDIRRAMRASSGL
eukprot:TRINITY_DN2995_c0_g1_i1.p1 TRINITY_DN2995_c0_g1~~TRINITY_DN2995_c0_g1_i1.p1  ORF type:complete len:417 (-),score=156.62 TRINITY_DN2995_c0_g1_i1:47-1297(-)